VSLKTTLLTLQAFWQARHRLHAATREQLISLQQRRLNAFLARDAAQVPAFTAYRGQPLSNWPVMDKPALMGDFAAYNRLGLTAEEGWLHERAGTAPKGHAIGASTGTSGNRGLYVVSEAERCRWLGVMLAWALPDVLKRAHRVAMVLPAKSRLYDTANESGRLKLRFFDLTAGIEQQFASLVEFRPTVIVGPPKFLRALAEADVAIQPERIFSGAEVLDLSDRQVIEARFGLIMREIYMATEGLFGVSCPLGTLHLIEDHIAFEFQPVDGSDRLVNPLVTDFSRKTQVMVRYRMNDILELADAPCACGLPHQAVRQIHGRQDDVFRLTRPDGNMTSITPDVIRNAVVRADASVRDFRVLQTGPSAVTLLLAPDAAPALEAARTNLQALFEGCGVHPAIEARAEPLKPEGGRKLRRVMVLPQGQRS
jgi:putative adenylate-forming enzyme